MLPAASLAAARSVCDPTARPPNVGGTGHEPQRPASSEHSKVAAESFEARTKSAPVLTDSAGGPDSIVVSGGRSIVHSWKAGEPSATPAAEIARTSKR